MRLRVTYFTAPSICGRSPPRHISTKELMSMTSNQTNMLKMSPVRNAPQTPSIMKCRNTKYPWRTLAAPTSASEYTATARPMMAETSTMMADVRSPTKTIAKGAGQSPNRTTRIVPSAAPATSHSAAPSSAAIPATPSARCAATDPRANRQAKAVAKGTRMQSVTGSIRRRCCGGRPRRRSPCSARRGGPWPR